MKRRQQNNEEKLTGRQEATVLRARKTRKKQNNKEKVIKNIATHREES